MIPIDLFSRL